MLCNVGAIPCQRPGLGGDLARIEPGGGRTVAEGARVPRATTTCPAGRAAAGRREEDVHHLRLVPAMVGRVARQ